MSKETNKLSNVGAKSTAKRPFARKEVLRDCTVQNGKPIPVIRGSSAKKPLEYINVECDKADGQETKDDDGEPVGGLSEPQLLSSLQIAEDIMKVKTVKCKKITGQLHPQSNFKPKNLKRINIPFEEQVYKNLVNLSVKDEDVIGAVKNVPKAKEVTKPKDPEPVLSDYYQPKFDKEYIVKCPVPLYEVEKVWSYNGFSISDSLEKYGVM
ncbi:hypothetical protein AAG570_003747 [Ranatra chinensis]|uniref:Protein phosphatase 1 regulatory subunit 35 C-terminal domain-containing protein n=1 Tax=Ranatra chinensis TaxID=642074 RepID=A0ABD0Y4Z1_9HEMI